MKFVTQLLLVVSCLIVTIAVIETALHPGKYLLYVLAFAAGWMFSMLKDIVRRK